MTDQSAEYERPGTWPERLRAVARWLDLTDPIIAEYMRHGEDSPLRAEALAVVDGKTMQADLRLLADELEAQGAEQ